MSWWEGLALVLGGLVAGVVNTVAGGGSLLTLPLLMFVGGMGAADANGTNRVGVLVGSLTAGEKFRRQEMLPRAMDAGDAVVACVGAAIGATASLPLDEAVLRKVIGVVLLAMLGVLLARPTDTLDTEGTPWSRPARGVVYLGIGLYGGFVQAGVGVLLATAGVVAAGLRLADAHAAKVGLVALFTLPALGVFVAAGHVHWMPGLLLAAGASVGGVLGARFTVSWGPGVLRALLIAAVLVASSRLLLGA